MKPRRAFVLAGFLVPYAFVYNTALLRRGPRVEVVWVGVTAGLGVLLASEWSLRPALPGEKAG